MLVILVEVANKEYKLGSFVGSHIGGVERLVIAEERMFLEI